MTLTRWSSKYITYVEGQSLWVRADHVESMRERMVNAGHTETGKSLVTGGKTFHEFLMGGEG